MKVNKLVVLLIIIIVCLISYIIYDKAFINIDNNTITEEETIKVIDEIKLDYVSILLTSDGNSYIKPLNKNEIDKLDAGKNLKERLNTLYDRAFYYDVYIDNNKLKGYLVKLNDTIKSIKKIEKDDDIFIVFIKENNTIGLFNYIEYYDLLYTDVIDNYKDYSNIKDVKNNKIIYLDGSSDYLK